MPVEQQVSFRKKTSGTHDPGNSRAIQAMHVTQEFCVPLRNECHRADVSAIQGEYSCTSNRLRTRGTEMEAQCTQLQIAVKSVRSWSSSHKKANQALTALQLISNVSTRVWPRIVMMSLIYVFADF